MPKTGGFALAFHSNAVKKLAWSFEIALLARMVRKTAMAAMITRRRMPDPRERPVKIRSPGRVTVSWALGGGTAVAVGVMSIGILRSGGGALPRRRCTGTCGRPREHARGAGRSHQER